MDIHQYWRTVARQREGLPAGVEVFHLTSVADESQARKGGVVSEVDREGTARALANQTHRLSTDAEVEQYRADQKNQRDSIAKYEHDRKQEYALPPEIRELLKTVATREAAVGSKSK